MSRSGAYNGQGLAQVLAVAALLTGCVENGSLQRCDEAAHLSDSANCGCGGPCGDTKVCVQGLCTCPAGAVQCMGRCESPSGSSCLCLAGEHLQDANNCACAGPCSSGQRCIDGLCRCDAAQHASDAEDCGCTGAKCATGQVCTDGRCVCPAGLAWCSQPGKSSGEFACMPAPCCIADAHLSDTANCGCMGPCPPGIACALGSCSVCDPLQNASNSKNCGCTGACQATEICQAGQCTCKPGLYACFATVGPFTGQTVCNATPALGACADCLDACDTGQTCSVRPGMTLAGYMMTGQAIFQCCTPTTGGAATCF